MSELWQALAQGILIGSTYGLLALGMGLVYGVSGVVNFAHGDFISLAMFMCLALYSALSIVESKLIILGDVVLRLPHVIACVVAFAMAIGLYVMLRSTDFGRSIRAVHQNAHAAALMGVDVGRVQVMTFAMGVGILAVAAALLLPGTPIQPTQGLQYTVITLLVVVLGGMTNFVGIMLGGLVIGISEALGTVYVSDTLGRLVPYAIFVLIMLFRPQGLTWRAS